MTAPGAVAAGETGEDARHDPSAGILDQEHLRRMTLGDRQLEREVLQLFIRQTAVMLPRILDADPAKVAAAAHTLVGSARGVGAWRVAQAAESVERAVGRGNEEERGVAIAELRASILEAGAAIGALLGDRMRYLSEDHDCG
jgi:HPt (histidine-containing phosphotransfer) domain-containing protein